MFTDKARMVRAANGLLGVFSIAPALYIAASGFVVLSGRGLASDQRIVSFLFPTLAVVSAINLGLMIVLQLRWHSLTGKVPYDPVNRVFLIVATGAILSNTMSIYGLVLSLLSGSIFYVIGFSVVTWTSLLWVRARFKQNLAKIPNE